MESVSSLGPQGKRARLGYQLTLHMGDSEPPQTQFPVDNIFRYMMALKTIIFTMGKVGAFHHEEEGERVIFAPLTPLLAHLAAAEAYALKFTLKNEFTHHAVLESLIQVDESIRGEWCKSLREEPYPSLGKAIANHRAFASALWLTRLQKDEQSFKPNVRSENKGAGKQKGQIEQWQPQVQGKLDYGKAAAKGGKNKKGDASSSGGTPMIAQKSKSGKIVCKYFQAGGCNIPQCWYEHSCDIVLPDGSTCGGNHTRAKHRGQFKSQ